VWWRFWAEVKIFHHENFSPHDKPHDVASLTLWLCKGDSTVSFYDFYTICALGGHNLSAWEELSRACALL
jgi:hypothetical protein